MSAGSDVEAAVAASASDAKLEKRLRAELLEDDSASDCGIEYVNVVDGVGVAFRSIPGGKDLFIAVGHANDGKPRVGTALILDRAILVALKHAIQATLDGVE